MRKRELKLQPMVGPFAAHDKEGVYLASFLQIFPQDSGTHCTERDSKAVAGTIEHDLRAPQSTFGPGRRARLDGPCHMLS